MLRRTQIRQRRAACRAMLTVLWLEYLETLERRTVHRVVSATATLDKAQM